MAIESVIAMLPDPAERFFAVTVHDRAVPLIVQTLRE